MDIDTMHWLDVGMAEVDQAETLEEARDEARGLAINAALRLADAAERVWLFGFTRSEGHPLAEALKDFKTAHNKLTDIYADMRMARQSETTQAAYSDRRSGSLSGEG